MKHGILMHEPDDDVGVAVEDLEAGVEIGAVTLEGKPAGAVNLVDNVPLGHKIAMNDLRSGQDVIEYGRVIATALQDAPRGSHIHIHNIKTKRWKS